MIRAGLQPDLGIDASRLAYVAAGEATTPAGSRPERLSLPDFRDLLAHQRAFDSVTAWTSFTNAVAARGRSELLQGEAVTGTYFATAGVPPRIGRLLRPDDDRPDAAPVAVIGEALWRRVFQRDPRVIGAVAKIGGRPFDIVGVAPESFRGLDRPRGFGQPEIWIPLSSAKVGSQLWAWQNPDRRDRAWLWVVGRLAPNRDAEAATIELRAVADRLDATVPLPDVRLSGGASFPQSRRWRAAPVNDSLDLGSAGSVLRAILLLPVLVLLVACTNLANFALSRGTARQGEFGIHRALGASRWQIVRGQLIEYALIAAAGGVGALLVADQVLALVAATIEQIFGSSPQYRISARVDSAVLLATAGGALLSLVVAGLIPALQLTRRSLSQTMAGGQDAALPRWRGRSNLIALQLSVTLTLLLVAALCLRQLPRLADRARLGVSLDRVAQITVPFELHGMAADDIRRIISQMLASQREAPGVASIAAASDARFLERAVVGNEGAPLDRTDRSMARARLLSVSPAYFATVGQPMVAGRAFGDLDAEGTEPVGVVTMALAKRVFGTSSAVGRRIGVLSESGGQTTPELITVVGVAGDVRMDELEPEALLYRPMAQRHEALVPLAIQARAEADGDPETLARRLRDALRRIDPDVAVMFVGRADAAFAGPGAALRLVVVGAGVLGLLALVFAMSGLYGILSHVVARRTRELGVRAALGAGPGDLVKLVLKDGARPVIEGVVIGLGLAAGARLGMQPWFTTPVSAVDPVAIVIAVVPLVVAAGVASYLPARRASRVHPNVALRHL